MTRHAPSSQRAIRAAIAAARLGLHDRALIQLGRSPAATAIGTDSSTVSPPATAYSQIGSWNS